MRLGGMILKPWNSPQEWAALAVEAGYGAVYFPVDYRADQKTIDAYARAAGERGLVVLRRDAAMESVGRRIRRIARCGNVEFLQKSFIGQLYAGTCGVEIHIEKPRKFL